MSLTEEFKKSAEILAAAKRKATPLQDVAKEVFKERITADSIDAVINYAASESEKWRNDFNEAFSKEYGKKVEFVEKFSDAEIEAMQNIEGFAITVGDAETTNIKNLIKTNVLTAGDALFKRDSILSKVQVITDRESYKLPEFGLEMEADRVDEDAATTSKDDVARDGDVLSLNAASNKLKARNVISKVALQSLNATDYGTMRARLIRSMMRKIENEVFNGNNNGGAACGVMAGDSTFGAIALTFPTTAGTRPVNHMDALEYMVGELPQDIDDADLARYVFAFNNRTAIKIMRAMNANTDYYFVGKQHASILSAIPFYKTSVLANDSVGLVDLSKCYVLMNEYPTLEVRELDNEMFEVKSVCYLDGGVTFAYKDQPNKNAHRRATLKADYTA